MLIRRPLPDCRKKLEQFFICKPYGNIIRLDKFLSSNSDILVRHLIDRFGIIRPTTHRPTISGFKSP